MGRNVIRHVSIRTDWGWERVVLRVDWWMLVIGVLLEDDDDHVIFGECGGWWLQRRWYGFHLGV